jgi:branched-chain amino acid transport system substrate-binding protein
MSRGKGLVIIATLLMLGRAAAAQNTPGVTASEIKLGQTMPYSGPASAYAAIGKGSAAYVKMINEKGGVGGHKITLISLDDGYAPPKTVEQTRRLVEKDQVAFIFNSLGTAPNSAIQKYLNKKGIPQLFVATGADKWSDPKGNRWTIGWQPSYRVEARIYARYISQNKPDAKICVLYQNDDFGKDYIAGLKDVLKEGYSKKVVKEASYEVTDPTVDSQVVDLKASGCNTLVTAATPKFAAQAIRKVYDIGWKPLHFLSNVSVSIASVMQPAGMDKGVGIITGAYLKDPNDPSFKDDPAMNEWRAFMKKYLPGENASDVNFVYAYAVSETMVQVLKQCGKDLSRENVLKQAASLKAFKPSLALPGIELNTTANDYRPFSQMQLAKFNGKSFERFGSVISGE